MKHLSSFLLVFAICAGAVMGQSSELSTSSERAIKVNQAQQSVETNMEGKAVPASREQNLYESVKQKEAAGATIVTKISTEAPAASSAPSAPTSPAAPACSGAEKVAKKACGGSGGTVPACCKKKGAAKGSTKNPN